MLLKLSRSAIPIVCGRAAAPTPAPIARITYLLRLRRRAIRPTPAASSRAKVQRPWSQRYEHAEASSPKEDLRLMENVGFAINLSVYPDEGNWWPLTFHIQSARIKSMRGHYGITVTRLTLNDATLIF